MTHEGADGVHFAVWAPHARRVSVVGEFNAWDGRRHPMRKRIDSGLWEIFLPGVAEGALYKYEILPASSAVLPLKADPFGQEAQMRPSTASAVASSRAFAWTDSDYLDARKNNDPRRAPMSIYEVHLGSWRRGEGNRFLTYDELADSLIPYAREQGLHPSGAAAGRPSIRSTPPGATSRSACSRRPRASARPRVSSASSTAPMRRESA